MRTRYNNTAVAPISLHKNCHEGVKLGIISHLGGNNRSSSILLTMSRKVITRALEENAAPAIEQSNYTVTDEELLRRLYGL